MSGEAPSYDGLDGAGLRIGVVAARFNEPISSSLLHWAREGLARHGVADGDVTVVWAPGAFELPLLARKLVEAGHDAVICLGAVVRGGTPHFDYVAGEAARGIMSVGLETGVPVLFGVLTTDTMEQAEERSRDDETNKGYEAALGAIDAARTIQRLAGD